jgi:hypothetical protein
MDIIPGQPVRWAPGGAVLPCRPIENPIDEARNMTTKLDRPLKREIVVDEKPYTLTIDANGLKLVEKGRRNGHEVSWKQVLSAAPPAA